MLSMRFSVPCASSLLLSWLLLLSPPAQAAVGRCDQAPEKSAEQAICQDGEVGLGELDEALDRAYAPARGRFPRQRDRLAREQAEWLRGRTAWGHYRPVSHRSHGDPSGDPSFRFLNLDGWSRQVSVHWIRVMGGCMPLRWWTTTLNPK